MSKAEIYFYPLSKGFLGISPNETQGGFKNIEFKPNFVCGLDFCEGFINTDMGKISVSWKREEQKICYKVNLPKGINATFEGASLKTGENEFVILP